MDEKMELNGAPCADVRALEAAAVAVPKGAKKYVKPAMQVFPLGCGLLATSGVVSGPPVQVSLTPMGIDWYHAFAGYSVRHKVFGYLDGTQAVCIAARGWDFECGDLGSTFMSRYAASATALREYADDLTDCSNLTFWGTSSWVSCGRGILETPDPTPVISFGAGGEGWTAAEFFAGAQFDECSWSGDTTFSGTYQGRRFEGSIKAMEFLSDGYGCSPDPTPSF
ncbi:MAG: hypothetical protein IJ722_00970 [Alloprevotella sp.]|nr:hypothetical protein [Alloprevotella sp.]